jgi:hypothetical protein
VFHAIDRNLLTPQELKSTKFRPVLVSESKQHCARTNDEEAVLLDTILQKPGFVMIDWNAVPCSSPQDQFRYVYVYALFFVLF